MPTLVVAAEDDTLAPYKDSRAMAERIPGAWFVSVGRGGHALTQLDAGARRAVADFIDAAGRPGAHTAPVLAEGGLSHGRQSVRRRLHGPLGSCSAGCSSADRSCSTARGPAFVVCR